MAIVNHNPGPEVTSNVPGEPKRLRSHLTVDEGGISLLTSTLTNSLYSDIVRTVVRELLSNAYDEHRKYGVPKRVDISLPTMNDANPVLIIQDYAHGMNYDFLTNHLLEIGFSTKRGTNEQVGQYGLGLKSAWGYLEVERLEQFALESVFLDSETGSLRKIVLSCYRDSKTGSPAAEIIYDGPAPSEAETGCKFTIPVRKGTIDKVVTEVSEIYNEAHLNVINKPQKFWGWPNFEGKHTIFTFNGELPDLRYELTYVCNEGVKSSFLPSPTCDARIYVADMPYSANELLPGCGSEPTEFCSYLRQRGELLSSAPRSQFASFYLKIHVKEFGAIALSPDRTRILNESHKKVVRWFREIRHKFLAEMQDTLNGFNNPIEAFAYLKEHFHEEPSCIYWQNGYYPSKRYITDRQYTDVLETYDNDNNQVNTTRPRPGARLITSAISNRSVSSAKVYFYCPEATNLLALPPKQLMEVRDFFMSIEDFKTFKIILTTTDCKPFTEKQIKDKGLENTGFCLVRCKNRDSVPTPLKQTKDYLSDLGINFEEYQQTDANKRKLESLWIGLYKTENLRSSDDVPEKFTKEDWVRLLNNKGFAFKKKDNYYYGSRGDSFLMEQGFPLVLTTNSAYKALLEASKGVTVNRDLIVEGFGAAETVIISLLENLRETYPELDRVMYFAESNTLCKIQLFIQAGMPLSDDMKDKVRVLVSSYYAYHAARRDGKLKQLTWDTFRSNMPLAYGNEQGTCTIKYMEDLEFLKELDRRYYDDVLESIRTNKLLKSIENKLHLIQEYISYRIAGICPLKSAFLCNGGTYDPVMLRLLDNYIQK
jgi:hypothetical protein